MENSKEKKIHETWEKLTNAMKEKTELVFDMIKNKKGLSSLVSISDGNTKMGKIASVSLLPWVTCPWNRCKNTCAEKCYAKKLCMLRPTVLNSYAKNTAIAKHATKSYFKAINKACQNIRFFRYHVSGDIPNEKYFQYMIKTCKNNPFVEFLCFTKQYEIVNEWIDNNGNLPNNLHLLFSEWVNLKAINPHNLPTTTVYYSENDIKKEWNLCGGNCLTCAVRGSHCWKAENGQTIAFKIH